MSTVMTAHVWFRVSACLVMQGTLAVAKMDNVLLTITISLSCKLDPCSQVEKLSFSPDLCFGARIDISESVWAYANS